MSNEEKKVAVGGKEQEGGPQGPTDQSSIQSSRIQSSRIPGITGMITGTDQSSMLPSDQSSSAQSSMADQSSPAQAAQQDVVGDLHPALTCSDIEGEVHPATSIEEATDAADWPPTGSPVSPVMTTQGGCLPRKFDTAIVSDHCPHPFLVDNQGDRRVEHTRCCWCGVNFEVVYRRAPDPEHGPYNNKPAWVPEEP